MKKSLIRRLLDDKKICTIDGVEFKLDPFLMLLWLIPSGGGLLGNLQIASIWIYVLIHELGHAIVARWAGYHPLTITLSILGGTTKIQGFEHNFYVKNTIWVALAGPIANLLLVGILLLIVASGLITYKQVEFCLQINLILGLANLLPTLPLDGGRILHTSLGPDRWVISRNVGFITCGALFLLGIYLSAWFLCVMSVMGVVINYVATKNFLDSEEKHNQHDWLLDRERHGEQRKTIF